MIEPSEIEALWQDLSLGPAQASQLKQLVIIFLSLGLAWMLHRILRPKQQADRQWQFGVMSFHRVLFPLSALCGVELGKHILHPHQSVRLLNAAASLLIALTIIRLSVYILRNVFSEARWLKVSEKSLVALIWTGFALHMTGQLSWIINALDELDFSIGKHQISVLMLINGALSVTITLMIALWIGRAIERKILASEVLDSSLRVMLAKLSRALLVIVGVMIALPLVGVDLTLFSVFGGAFGVGLGLGLQKIASNYVSGFIILIDRSIRLGDFLTVDHRYGQVTRLTARYMVLQSSDGTEAIIPNDTLVTSVVINHTYSNPLMLVQIPIMITHDSDQQKARDIMLASANTAARILVEPSAVVLIKALTPEGIALELNAWISDPENGTGPLRSEILVRIDEGFKANGIRIPAMAYMAGSLQTK
ncbi:mechanosensitive ion channel family protein [Leeia oryzae]|uniref:mechanosensitive ion channel family protein n=1 Tax=Leeia oryzae TaxID=356662 RepID=UPI000377CCB4|nr:mechanosensitive ion channel domain-containing protein [Leeia oryzae]